MDAGKVATIFDLYETSFAKHFFIGVHVEACLHLTSISGVHGKKISVCANV